MARKIPTLVAAILALVILAGCVEFLRGPAAARKVSTAFYQWTKTFGCGEDDRGHAIQAAANGRVFAAGHFAVFANLDPFGGADYHITSDRKDDPKATPTNADLYLIGFDKDEHFHWARQLGPWADGYKIDAGGSQDFVVPDPSDAIPAVLTVDSYSTAIANVFIAGYYEKPITLGGETIYPKYPDSFDKVLTPDDRIRRLKESKDVFVTKYTQDGDYCWTKTIGGKGEEVVTGIRSDREGSVYVSGLFGLNWNTQDPNYAVNFDPETSPNTNPVSWPQEWRPDAAQPMQLASVKVVDPLRGDAADTRGKAFIWKLNDRGELAWVFTLPALNVTISYDSETGQVSIVYNGALGFFDMATDDFSNLYVGGAFDQTRDFDPGPVTTATTAVGMGDAFVAKYTKYGDFQWVVKRGSANVDGVASMALAPSGSLYAAGVYNNTDVFIMKLDRDGNDMWRTPTAEGLKIVPGLASLGGMNGNSPDPVGKLKILLDDKENLYLVGRFIGTQNFKTADSTRDDFHTSAGFADTFVSKLSPTGFFEWTVTFGGEGYDVPSDASFDGDGNLYITGFFESNGANFNPSGGYDWKSTAGKYDVFITKLKPQAKTASY